jgi:hypothetical protein
LCEFASEGLGALAETNDSFNFGDGGKELGFLLGWQFLGEQAQGGGVGEIFFEVRRPGWPV